MKISRIALAISGLVLSGAVFAAAESRLVVYCSAQNTMCEQEVLAFEQKYKIKTNSIRGSTGSIFARIEAEKANPQGDVWYGGTLDPHSQAGEMGLLEAYKSPNLQYIPDALKDPANLHEHSIEKEKGAPVELIVPCEGTGYEIGGVSIIKGARNPENAKLFVDWALSKEAQELSWKKGESHQILTNSEAEMSPYSLDFKSINLINYDFDKYGASDVRKRLIKRWVDEVKLGK